MPLDHLDQALLPLARPARAGAEDGRDVPAGGLVGRQDGVELLREPQVVQQGGDGEQLAVGLQPALPREPDRPASAAHAVGGERGRQVPLRQLPRGADGRGVGQGEVVEVHGSILPVRVRPDPRGLRGRAQGQHARIGAEAVSGRSAKRGRVCACR